MSELIKPVEEARSILEIILSCRSAKKHKELWQRMLCGHWLEVIEIGRAFNVGATSARGVAHSLATLYRKDKNNPKKKIKQTLQFIDLMYREMESGRNLRQELEPLAVELDLGEIVRGVTASSSLTHACEAEAIPADQVIVLSASDPHGRHYALKQKAERLRSEYPAPSLNKFAGQTSIGRALPEERAEWIAWIDKIAHSWSAPLYASDLVEISGAPARWVNAMYLEWKALLSQGLDADEKRSMALGLVAEAESIAREAFALYSHSEDERSKGASLKLALDALDRRLKILNVSSKDLEKVEVKATMSLQDQASKLGLNEKDLKQIADLASKAMHKNN
jgi:hypothetical protein